MQNPLAVFVFHKNVPDFYTLRKKKSPQIIYKLKYDIVYIKKLEPLSSGIWWDLHQHIQPY